MNPQDRLKEATILIVEDDEIARIALAKMVRRLCKSVLEASNGKEGLEMELLHRPDIVLTDLEMPVMSGMELVERLKERDAQRPVVVVTAFADEAHQTPRADRILTKPIERSVLHEALYEMASKL